MVHVRGTPTSGKSVPADLLRRHYLRHNVPAVMISVWPKNDPDNPPPPHTYQCRGVRSHDIFFDLVFIFQMSFHYHDLWLGFVKTQSDTNLGPRICVFSSYGSPTVAAEGFDYDRINGSPLAHLGVQQRVSITVSVIEGSPSIYLFYTRTEFEDAVRRLCTRVRKPLPLHKGAIDYIFTLTKGHPGAVKAVVKMIQKVSRAVYFCFRSLTAAGLPRGYQLQARNN